MIEQPELIPPPLAGQASRSIREKQIMEQHASDPTKRAFIPLAGNVHCSIKNSYRFISIRVVHTI